MRTSKVWEQLERNNAKHFIAGRDDALCVKVPRKGGKGKGEKERNFNVTSKGDIS